MKRYHKQIITYVESGLKKIKGRKPRYECVVTSGRHVANTAIAYAEKTKAKAICISTRGAGQIKKILGTTASKIIAKSKTPVFVIPINYQKAPLKEIFYATDLHNFKAEMRRIRPLADLTKARITAYHYGHFQNLAARLKQIKESMKTLSSTRHLFRVRELHPEFSLSYHLLQDMEESNASIAVLFTDQKKAWFKKLFLPGNSAELTFKTKRPLLIFEK